MWYAILGHAQNQIVGYYTPHLVGDLQHLLFSPTVGMMIQSDKYFSEGLKPPTSHAYLTIISPKTVFPNYAYHCLASNVRISCPTIQSSSAVFLANFDAWQTWLAGKKPNHMEWDN